MDCNDTKTFFKELKRMCNYYYSTCSGCEIYDICRDSGCYGFIKNNPLRAIEIVQRWSNEHPIKTRQSEFLKMFPNANIVDGLTTICPKVVDMEISCLKELTCDDCIREYWLAEVE